MKEIKKAVLLLLLASSMFNCSSFSTYPTQNITRDIDIHKSILRQGAWGEWRREFLTKVYIGRVVKESLTFYSVHPADKHFEVIPLNYLGTEGLSHKYEGKVIVDFDDDIHFGLAKDYTYKPKEEDCQTDSEGRCYLTFSCIILSSDPLSRVVSDRGTINVFYNDVGRGYSF